MRKELDFCLPLRAKPAVGYLDPVTASPEEALAQQQMQRRAAGGHVADDYLV